MTSATGNQQVNFRPSMTMQWWAVGTTSGSNVSWKVIQSATRPSNLGAAVGPFPSQKAAQNWVSTIGGQAQAGSGLPNLNPLSWLSNLGGMIASGIEGGIVQLLKDVWAVVVGPLEVVAGALICFAVLVVYFKNDIASLIGVMGM